MIGTLFLEVLILISKFPHLEIKSNCGNLIVSTQQRQRSQLSSVAQSCPTLQPHEPQHARPPYPSPTPGAHPNPCPLVGGVNQPSHPLSSPSHTLNLSQNEGLSFQMCQLFT